MGEQFSSQPMVAPPGEPPEEGGLVYSNEWGEGFRYRPGRLQVELAVPPVRRRFPGAERAWLVLPDGWRVAGEAGRAFGDGATIAWAVTPGRTPDSCRPVIACEVFTAGGRRVGRVERAVRLELRGRSQFDPRRHALPFRNAVADLGSVEPRGAIFARTYRAGGAVLPGAFFRGLYRDIVFLTAATDARGSGGLCTGMARVALERSLAGDGAAGGDDRAALRERVEIWHGRQLTDGALRAAARWFFRGSPAAALAEFRGQLLATGRSEVAFDVGVARWAPSRRLLARLVRHGHTIVPYAFRQTAEAALVFVYDPSYPSPEDLPNNAIRFDLRRDRYAYRGFGSLTEDDGTTIIAAGQGAFRAPGTAFLASLVNVLLHPETVVGAVRRGVAPRRVAPIAGAGLLGGLARALGRRGGV